MISKYKKLLSQYPYSTIEDRPVETVLEKRTPTIKDLVKFTGSFETFNPNVYQLPTSDGTRIQDLTGFGFADKESINLARQGKMTREFAENRLEQKLQSEIDSWHKLLPETKNLPVGVMFALADTSFNGKGVQGTINSSPNLVNTIKSGITDPKEIVKHLTHSKNKVGWLGARSAARRAMALGEYDWDNKSVDKYGRQVDYNKYKGPKDYLSSPYYGKYQTGGQIKSLVYKPYTQDSEVESEIDLSKYLDFSNYGIGSYFESTPIEQVKIYQPQSGTKETVVSARTVAQTNPEKTEPKTEITKKVEEPTIEETKPQVDNTRVKAPVVEAKATEGKVYKSSEKQEFKQTLFSAYKTRLLAFGLNDNLAENFAKRLVAQDVNESNWGQSSLSKQFNFGGIKDFRKNSNASQKDTVEYVNGIRMTKKQPFRSFNNLEEYVDYKIDLLNRKWNVFSFNPDKMYDIITSGKTKYATDPKYAEKLNNIYNKIW